MSPSLLKNYSLEFSSQGGTPTLRNLRIGESMHSAVGSWEEAMQVYIQGADFSRLARLSRPAIIYDVGLGIGANALALLETFQTEVDLLDFPRIQVYSFESDLTGLEFALHEKERFPFLQRNEGLLRALLCEKKVSLCRPALEWFLMPGDWRERLTESIPRADLIFFDLFSPKKCPELWGIQAFQKCYQHLTPEGLWMTYSASTAVRSGLLLSGFFVGEGPSTSQKQKTTQASPSLSRLQRPLDQTWFSKLALSSHPYPVDEKRPLEERERLILERLRGVG